MTADLDLASWDEYVGQGHLRRGEEGDAERLRPRVEAAELLGDGDAAGLGELGSGEQRAGIRARRGRWPGRRLGMARMRSSTGSGARR